MAKAGTKTFRLSDRDEWLLERAGEIMAGEPDMTARFRFLMRMAEKQLVSEELMEPYREPSPDELVDPALRARARAGGPGPHQAPESEQAVEPETQERNETGNGLAGDVAAELPEPVQAEVPVEAGSDNRNKECNKSELVNIAEGGDEPAEDDLERVVEDTEELQVSAFFDDGPMMPEGWEPSKPGAYDQACKGCGMPRVRWVGPRGQRVFQDEAGTIHDPRRCHQRRKAASGAV